MKNVNGRLAAEREDEKKEKSLNARESNLIEQQTEPT